MQKRLILIWGVAALVGCGVDAGPDEAPSDPSAAEEEAAPEDLPFTVDTQVVAVPDAGP